MRDHWQISGSLAARFTRAAMPCLLVLNCAAFWATKLAAAEPAATMHSLPDDVRMKLASRLKQRKTNTRVAALQELADYQCLEAVQLVLLYGLRDRLPEVHETAIRALRRHKTDAPIGTYLVRQWVQETTAKKRVNQDYAQRLLEIACEYRLPEVYRELLQVADAGEPAVAGIVMEAMMAAIDKAAVERDASLLKILEPLITSHTAERSFGFRRCVIDAAAQLRHVDAVAFLIRQIRNNDGELRHAIVQHLRRITRQSLKPDTNDWQKWWQSEQATFQFADETSLAVRWQDAEQGTPLYYDIPIHAKRLVFVLDTSRSMSAATTVSRLEAAKRELVQAIEKLPADTLFNVIVFNSTVSTWSERMAPAAPVWKAHAAAFVRSQKPVGKTATYDALHAAFQLDPHLEAIYLLSDGEPSDGAVIRPNMLLDAIRKENRTRRLTIHTIGLIGRDPDATGLEDFMRKLAAQNFGQFRRAE